MNQSSPVENSLYRLYVGNIGPHISEAELRTLVEQFGIINRILLVKDEITGLSRGYAFVDMTHQDAAARAIAKLNGRVVDGHSLVARPLF